MDEIRDQLSGAHMAFITAGMGGGTGTGAAPVIARAAREMGILTVGVVTKPFQFEGARRMRTAEAGVHELQQCVDTLIVIPNQNLFRVANEKTTFADAFAMADQVLYSGVACITDLMVKEGLINLDFADVRAIMRGMGKAMMGTGEASGEKRANRAAEAAIANPLLDDVSMKGARGLLISITGGRDLTLYELDEAATRIREEVDPEANIILGATFDESLEGTIRVSVVATGIDKIEEQAAPIITATEQRIAEVAERLRAEARLRATAVPAVPVAAPAPAPAVFRAEPRPLPVVPAPEPVAEVPVVAETPAPVASEADFGMDEEEAPVVAQPRARRFEMFPEPEAIIEAPAIVAAQPERAMRPTRMPRVEDLPPVAQKQIREQGRAVRPEPDSHEKRTLLQRLATVGFGRREEGLAHAPAEPAPAAVPPVVEAPTRAAVSPAHADYVKRTPKSPAYRAAQGQLDQQGRAAPTPRGMDDEHLEIPAFLRRQTN
jgi:cell division protein FtsZ